MALQAVQEPWHFTNGAVIDTASLFVLPLPQIKYKWASDSQRQGNLSLIRHLSLNSKEFFETLANSNWEFLSN